MGIGGLIIGKSGAGKSASLRNFKNGEVGIFNTTSKPLPFKNDLQVADNADYMLIEATLASNKLNCYVVDDSVYLMAFESFARANEKGFDKFTQMSKNYADLLEQIRHTSKDTIVYVITHEELQDDGSIKPKSIGKMLDRQLCLEGLFSICLYAKFSDGKYVFETQTDGNTPAKSPMGMFDDFTIDNNLKEVDTVIRKYYDLAPAGKNDTLSQKGNVKMEKENEKKEGK